MTYINLINNMNNFTLLVYLWIGIAIVTLSSLLVLKIRAPYGRHSTKKWGFMISNRLGWIIMEFPALTIFPLLVILGPAEKNWLTWLLFGLWLLHYINRTIIFPFRLRTKGKKMPIAIVLSAIVFNGMNGFINGYYLGYINKIDITVSFYDANVLIGLMLFIIGFAINQTADSKLIALRKENTGYKIPGGWLFEYISCPNHFGEIVEWIGFAVIAWSMPALSFAVWTFCNLLPRALDHHKWYYETFDNYPEKRKAVIPYVL